MGQPRLHKEDVVGVMLAVCGHALLIAWLVLAPKPKPVSPPERVTVTLIGDVAEQVGAPLQEEAAAAVAPVLAERPVPALATPVLPPVPPQVSQRKVVRPLPAPPRQSPLLPQRARIGRDLLPPSPVTPTPQSGQRAGGGSRIGADFLPDTAAGSGKAQVPVGQAIGPQVRASLAGEVSRQLKPKWNAPDGVDVDKLATTIAWDLNLDGSLAGPPRFVEQTGRNGSNSAQAERHKEQAISAVRRSSPFQLPPQFYTGWQHLRFTFDWKLDQ